MVREDAISSAGPTPGKCYNYDFYAYKLYRTGDAYADTFNFEEEARLAEGASSVFSRMSSSAPDAKGPPSSFVNPADGAESGGGGGGGGVCAGASVRPSSANSNSPPGLMSPKYLKWSENLQLLLNDGTGVELLLKYLEQEDQDCFYMLRFWLAVRGLQQQPDQDHLNKCILAIYKGLFNKIESGFSGDLRRSVAQRIRHTQAENKALDAKVFSDACKVVENEMTDRMYPNFLSSDVYLNYVRKVQQDANSSSSNVDDFAIDELPKNFSQQTLPVVNEDEELSFDAYRDRPGPGSVTYSTASTRLMFDQQVPLRVHHVSYNPVSRQDSEAQSLSSGARTDSMPDLALEDANTQFPSNSFGSTYAQKRKQWRLNRNTDLVHIHEPRSSLPGIQERTCAPEPSKFMNSLLPKLEKLKQQKEVLECVGLKLNSIDEDLATDFDNSVVLNVVEDDDDQEILDRHVSRVWNEQTPKRSPSSGTPLRPKSPLDSRRTRSLHGDCLKDTHSSRQHWASNSLWSCYSNPPRRRDRDASSLFSTDSGNGTDRDRHHYRSPNKYKSASESCGDTRSNFYEPSYSGQFVHGSRTWSGSHRTMTDSGVSVAGSAGIVPPHRSRDRSSLNPWEMDNRRPVSSKHSTFSSGSHAFDDKNAAMFGGGKLFKNRTSHSRNKLENQHSRVGFPAQPFMADTNMPPYPYYSIDPQTTVEEVTRRLQELKGTKGTSVTSDSTQSNIGSRSTSQPSLMSEPTEYTSVVYNFSDENVPYLLRVQARPITLRIFKENSPKKGNFRYFFQTECEEFGGDKPIFEEITENEAILPLWRNKVISKITPM